jgi:hypothetical protein
MTDTQQKVQVTVEIDHGSMPAVGESVAVVWPPASYATPAWIAVGTIKQIAMESSDGH